MLKFSEKLRTMLAEMLFEFANIGAGALVFGQALSGGAYSPALAIVGMAFWIVVVVLAAGFVERGNK
jgi:hypothetical protein